MASISALRLWFEISLLRKSFKDYLASVFKRLDGNFSPFGISGFVIRLAAKHAA
jgi:hypothetical protein